MVSNHIKYIVRVLRVIRIRIRRIWKFKFQFVEVDSFTSFAASLPSQTTSVKANGTDFDSERDTGDKLEGKEKLQNA